MEVARSASGGCRGQESLADDGPGSRLRRFRSVGGDVAGIEFGEAFRRATPGGRRWACRRGSRRGRGGARGRGRGRRSRWRRGRVGRSAPGPGGGVAEQDGLAEVLVAAAARLGGDQLPEGSAGLGAAFGHARVSLATPASPWPRQRCSVPVLSVILAVPAAKVALPWPKSAADTRPVRPVRQQ